MMQLAKEGKLTHFTDGRKNFKPLRAGVFGAGLLLGKIIDGLEMVQENIPPLLAVFLDMDKDFEKFEKVVEVLGNIKAQVQGLTL